MTACQQVLNVGLVWKLRNTIIWCSKVQSDSFLDRQISLRERRV